MVVEREGECGLFDFDDWKIFGEKIIFNVRKVIVIMNLVNYFIVLLIRVCFGMRSFVWEEDNEVGILVGLGWSVGFFLLLFLCFYGIK